MLVVLGLIDVVMIANLLIMVIIGGYETFVSRLDLEGHPDQPEWLSHVNAGVLKIKLSTAIIGISSIHLLKTFINAEPTYERAHDQVAGHHPCAVPALGAGDGLGRPSHDPNARGLSKTPPNGHDSSRRIMKVTEPFTPAPLRERSRCRATFLERA
jgi:hypothetical protein